MEDAVLLHRSWGKVVPRIRYCQQCTETYLVKEKEVPWECFTYSKNPVRLIKKEGKYGEFWGCPNFPKCKYSESVTKKRKVFFDYDDELRPF